MAHLSSLPALSFGPNDARIRGAIGSTCLFADTTVGPIGSDGLDAFSPIASNRPRCQADTGQTLWIFRHRLEERFRADMRFARHHCRAEKSDRCQLDRADIGSTFCTIGPILAARQGPWTAPDTDLPIGPSIGWMARGQDDYPPNSGGRRYRAGSSGAIGRV